MKMVLGVLGIVGGMTVASGALAGGSDVVDV